MPGEVKDVEEELRHSDILCLTSEYEGFGIVLIEAMANGVPVIAFDYVGISDIVCDGEDGTVVPFGDTDAFAGRLRTLLRDRALRRQYASKALSSVHKFDKAAIMEQWTALFKDIASRTQQSL